MANDKALKKWEETWKPEIHTTDYSLKRIKSAQSTKLTPIKIDTTDFYGYFQGSHGKYETWLDYCPCGDFHRSKLPCKHIYRLAIELKLLDKKAENNQHAVLTPKAERIDLNETIDIVEKLSETAQHKLLLISGKIRSVTPTYQISSCAEITELLNSGLIIDADPSMHTICIRKKDELMELLDNENIQYDKKSKKSVLEEICIKYIPEKAKEKFGEKFYVTIPTQYSSQNIHNYLHRKYDSLSYVDDSGNLINIPLLETILPEDKITSLLIKHGYGKNIGISGITSTGIFSTTITFPS